MLCGRAALTRCFQPGETTIYYIHSIILYIVLYIHSIILYIVLYIHSIILYIVLYIHIYIYMYSILYIVLYYSTAAAVPYTYNRTSVFSYW